MMMSDECSEPTKIVNKKSIVEFEIIGDMLIISFFGEVLYIDINRILRISNSNRSNIFEIYQTDNISSTIRDDDMDCSNKKFTEIDSAIRKYYKEKTNSKKII